MKKCEWKDGEFKPCDGAYGIIDFSYGDLCLAIDSKGLYRATFCPFCGADIRKPVEIKVGMFGRFWDNSEKGDSKGYFGFLRHINSSGSYICHRDFIWDHFTPGLPEGFNQDGTPKEVDE